MLKFFRIPFAVSGDKVNIPDPVDVNGFVSYTDGFGFDYQRQKTDPNAKDIERDGMNGLFYDITAAVAELQSQGIPDFISTALNGGTPYSYPINAVVRYLDDLYVSIAAANVDLPSVTTKWAKLPTAARLQSAAYTAAVAGGTADAITSTFVPAITALPAAPGTLSVLVRASTANLTTTPTFAPGAVTAKTMVKGSNAALAPGDIAGAGHWLDLQYDPTLDKWVLQNPATGVTPAGGLSPGDLISTSSNTAPPGTLKANGAAVSRTTYAALKAATYKQATVTMTIASPGVISWTAHTLNANDSVQFTTTGTLPTGFVTATDYYVVGASITANTFQLSATPGGAAINTSGSQSGIHTAHNAPFGIGDGTTTFNVIDMRGKFGRGWNDDGSLDPDRSFGSTQLDQLQGHAHLSPYKDYNGSPGEISDGANFGSGAAQAKTLGAVTDATYGTARVGSESRPINAAVLICVKY